MDYRSSSFQEHRPKLYGMAYRMLGTRADAEDVLQDAYLRWHQADVERVRSAEAWLTTTVAHLCIDRLRLARSRREAYIGPWLPEPLVGDETSLPEQQSEQASNLSVAFLVMLERLAPEERAAFLLHDVFDYGYEEIAEVLDKREAAVRQIIHRARQRVRRDKRRFPVNEAAHRRLLERFVWAIRRADRETLLELFAPDASWMSDGGGKTAAARKALHSGASIAKLLVGVGRHMAAYAERLVFHLVPINGETGVMTWLDGRPLMAISLVTDGERILAGFSVLNPDKLARVPQQPPPGSNAVVTTPPIAPS